MAGGRAQPLEAALAARLRQQLAVGVAIPLPADAGLAERPVAGAPVDVGGLRDGADRAEETLAASCSFPFWTRGPEHTEAQQREQPANTS